MDWGDVRIFLAVVRTGSLGAAARQLEISHPTVGRRIRALEQQTGQALFRRVDGSLVVTDAGDTVLNLAHQMEASALAIERCLAGESDQLEGVIRISSADWFASYVLAPVLAEFVRRYPLVVPEVMAGHRLFDLSRREAEVAFRIVPFDDPNIVQRRVMAMPYGLYASATAPMKWNENGAGMGLIQMNSAQAHYPDVLWLIERFPKARVTFTSTSRSVQAMMCAHGLGLAVLPKPVGDATPGLRIVDVGEPPPERDIWMGYHQDLRRMDRLRALADIVGAMVGAPALPSDHAL